MNSRVILLMSSLTYRSNAFVAAAERLGLEVVKGVDMPRPVARMWRATLPLDFREPRRAVRDLVEFARRHHAQAIVSVDDAATVIAAQACATLGLPHNSPDAATAARNKLIMRQKLSEAGAASPRFRLFHTDDDPEAIGSEPDYPCVVKPILLSGSQGVIRADDPATFSAAFRRTGAIVLATGGEPGEHGKGHILVEDYIPGVEVELEGILSQGQLQVLALFDKPDPLVGPFFEETIYVTPSRLSWGIQRNIQECTVQACAALGLREGPIHAELRVDDSGKPWVVEIAGRSIGGLCSKILRFGTEGLSLEEVILRRAVGLPVDELQREGRAAGVMMIPIPRAGMLKRVDGLEPARAVSGIVDIDITLPVNHPVVPLPEGSSYLGFIFARCDRPDEVEAALREAHRRLTFTILPQVRLMRTG